MNILCICLKTHTGMNEEGRTDPYSGSMDASQGKDRRCCYKDQGFDFIAVGAGEEGS